MLLPSLEIIRCTAQTVKDVPASLRRFKAPRLRQLLVMVYSLDGDGPIDDYKEAFGAIAALISLHTVSFTVLDFEVCKTKFSVDFLLEKLSTLRELEEVSISLCCYQNIVFTNKVVRKTMRAWPELKGIAIHNNATAITLATLPTIVEHCPKLEHLNIAVNLLSLVPIPRDDVTNILLRDIKFATKRKIPITLNFSALATFLRLTCPKVPFEKVIPNAIHLYRRKSRED